MSVGQMDVLGSSKRRSSESVAVGSRERVSRMRVVFLAASLREDALFVVM